MYRWGFRLSPVSFKLEAGEALDLAAELAKLLQARELEARGHNRDIAGEQVTCDASRLQASTGIFKYSRL